MKIKRSKYLCTNWILSIFPITINRRGVFSVQCCKHAIHLHYIGVISPIIIITFSPNFHFLYLWFCFYHILVSSFFSSGRGGGGRAEGGWLFRCIWKPKKKYFFLLTWNCSTDNCPLKTVIELLDDVQRKKNGHKNSNCTKINRPKRRTDNCRLSA